MDLYGFLKNSKAYRIFEGDIKNNTLGHAYIVSAKDSLTARTLCHLFACLMLCTGKSRPCLFCSACSRALKGIHPDCTVYPLKGDKISVDDIDNLTDNSIYRPVEGDTKVYIVLNGETMNMQSQNKLLKTLEEPPEGTRILLGTANLQNLLPTVISRSKVIEAEQFAPEEIYSFLLAKYGEEASRIASAACGGMPGKAVQIAEDPEYIRLYNYVYTLLGRLDGFDGALECSAEIASFKDKNALLDALQLYFRDCLMVKSGQDNLAANKTAINSIKKAAAHYEMSSLIYFIESLNEAKRKMQLNCNFNAVIETLFNGIVDRRL